MNQSENMNLIGKVLFIDEPKDVSKTDKPFITTNIGLDISEILGGTVYDNFATLQCLNDRANDLFKEVNVGDKIRAYFSVKGVIRKKDDLQPSQKNPESKNGFNNLNLYKWEILERANAPVPTPASAPENQSQAVTNQSDSTPPVNTGDLPF